VLSNFEETLPAGDADDEAPLLLRDPLVVDFVTSADARRERSLENALVADITRFMHALGDGLLYAGRQRAIDLGEGQPSASTCSSTITRRAAVSELSGGVPGRGRRRGRPAGRRPRRSP
jgi:YhcG PDDEXK nuclease domain